MKFSPQSGRLVIIKKNVYIAGSMAKKLTNKNLNTLGDKFFIDHPDKVLGEQSIQEYMNQIIVKGNKEDVIKYFNSK